MKLTRGHSLDIQFIEPRVAPKHDYATFNGRI
jgi:hypothetical protein